MAHSYILAAWCLYNTRLDSKPNFQGSLCSHLLLLLALFQIAPILLLFFIKKENSQPESTSYVIHSFTIIVLNTNIATGYRYSIWSHCFRLWLQYLAVPLPPFFLEAVFLGYQFPIKSQITNSVQNLMGVANLCLKAPSQVLRGIRPNTVTIAGIEWYTVRPSRNVFKVNIFVNIPGLNRELLNKSAAKHKKGLHIYLCLSDLQLRSLPLLGHQLSVICLALLLKHNESVLLRV